ncbi:hypothetical protein PYW07_011652 [Mythimna separata]|uniref:Cilia- and flagella-associated protein 263 n=1 Tax=Mythimna separata TaxID=271217 RepID=A0AAD7Y6T7_MYTSE|nr:hypothetical protein PYW07_011652 [Mythimna separata]
MSHAGRSGILSQNSRSMSNSRWDTDMDVLTDEELVRMVNELREKVNILTLENEILEKAILRLEPALMTGVYQALEYATRIPSGTSVNMTRSGVSKYGLADAFFSPSRTLNINFSKHTASRIMASPSRVSTRRGDSKTKLSAGTVIFGGTKINIMERAELVSREMEVQVTSLNRARDRGAKQHALLKAKLEEVGLKETDIAKATEMFRQEVLVEGWDKIAQRIPAEIWIRFMTEWVKSTDSQIGKLRLRTSTLNTQYSKLKGQIKIKTELSESLRPVDFEKLEIENGECLQIIEHKFQQLAELKKMTGDANLNLTVHKKAMMEQNNYLSKVLSTIKNKQLMTIQLDKESEKIQTQVDSLSQRLNEIRKVRSKYQVPNIMEYVEVKWMLTGLKHSIKVLETRNHIHQIALASINRKLQTIAAKSVTKRSSSTLRAPSKSITFVRKDT